MADGRNKLKIHIDDEDVFQFANWFLLAIPYEFNQDCEVLCVGFRKIIDDNFLSSFPNVKTILSPTTAIDHIKTTRRDIKIIHLDPSSIDNINASSEFAFLLILSLLRQAGSVFRGDIVIGDDLCGKTVGILGYGRIGKKLHKYCEVFGANVLFHDDAFFTYSSNIYRTKEDILRESDVIVVCVSAIPENRHYIDYEDFKLMSETPYFVNISRGFVVSDMAVIDALTTGKIRGAGLDVVESLSNYEWYNKPNLILTNHVAGSTTQSRILACNYILQKLNEEIICSNI